MNDAKVTLIPGKVVGPISDPSEYLNGNGKRGEPDFVMSRSSLAEFSRCPARWIAGYREADTDATEWGSLVDCLALTPADFRNRYAVAPVTYIDAKGPKTAKEKKPWNWNANVCKEWRSAQGDKLIVKHTQFGAASDAVKVLLDDEEAGFILAHSQRQVLCTATYQDEETKLKVPLRALMDFVPDKGHPTIEKTIGDLKTCSSAALRPWVRSVHDWWLDAQAALYLDIWNINTGEDRCDFRHIVQESFSPYHVEKRLLSAEFLEIGRWRYLKALKHYCQCLKMQDERKELELRLAEAIQAKEFRRVEALKKMIAAKAWPGYEGGRDIDGWQLTEPEPWMVE